MDVQLAGLYDTDSIRLLNQAKRETSTFMDVSLFGGHEGDRTLDLTDANRTLSRRRKKYAPKKVS